MSKKTGSNTIKIKSNKAESNSRGKKKTELLMDGNNLKPILDAVQFGIVIVDAETHEIVEVNPTAAEIIGASKEQIVGRVCHGLISPAEWHECPVIEQGANVEGLERELINDDGEHIPIVKTVAVTSINGRKYLVESFFDITKLKLVEETYQTIFKNSAVGITVADEHERIISWNQFTEDLLGMKREDLYMQPVSSLYPVDEWKKIRSENVRKKGMQHHLETRMVKKDGKFIDIDISISVLKGPDGKITGSIGVMRDITERKRNEEQLQQAEQTYRTIFENSAVAITVTDDNERVISWNKFAEDLLGMSREDLYMKPVSSFYSKEEWDRIRGENIRQKGMQNHLETVMIKKNNEKIDVDISISVLKGPDGKITGSIGVIRDITERKNAEKQLKMAEERYRTIFESSAVAITVTDEDENIISWNSAAEVLLAMDNDDLYMKPVSSLYSKSEWTRIRSQSVREKGAQNHIETRIINKKKQLIDVDLSVKVLKDADGRVTGSIGVLTDIRDVGEFKKIQENYEQLVAAYRKQSLLLEEAGITPPESPVTNVDTGDSDDFLF